MFKVMANVQFVVDLLNSVTFKWITVFLMKLVVMCMMT